MKINEILEKMWIAIGDIHSQGKDVTNKDLEKIKRERLAEIKKAVMECLPERLDYGLSDIEAEALKQRLEKLFEEGRKNE